MEQSHILYLSIIIAIFFMVIAFYFRPTIEGLTGNKDDKKIGTTNQISGEAGGAENYLASLKANVVTVQNQLLISKYKSEYDSTLVQMDDYINLLMLKQILNIDMRKTNELSISKELENLVTLQRSKDALNDIVTYIDK